MFYVYLLLEFGNLLEPRAVASLVMSQQNKYLFQISIDNLGNKSSFLQFFILAGSPLCLRWEEEVIDFLNFYEINF